MTDPRIKDQSLNPISILPEDLPGAGRVLVRLSRHAVRRRLGSMGSASAEVMMR